jgi:2-phospho-L-lactate/phosphoenolpyruvate guanylyltransferase
MRTAAILPVKSFVRAKQRLGESVTDRLRLELASAMVADVLLALAQTASIETTILVTREASVAEAARKLGAVVIDDALEAGQSAAAGLGVAHALREGFQRVLCVPGDCPALDPAELDELLGVHPDEHPGQAALVTIIPDRHGAGTNGLLLAPPDAIAPSFGPNSCERHRALALAAGVEVTVRPLSSLVLDIDTGADLQALRERLRGHSERAARTRAVLGQPERTEIISFENAS